MARFINPVPQYTDDAGDILPLGKLFFFESGTTTEKTTFADAAEEIPNTHPVLLDAAGRVPNIFFTGSAKAILTNNDESQSWERDPVSADEIEGAFSTWLASETYDSGDIVTGSDGNYYRSNTNGNENNDPTSSTTWTKVRLLFDYNSTQTYDVDDVVIQNTQLYISQVAANLGNSPALGDVTKWKNLSNNFDLYVDSGAADAYVLTADSNTHAPQVYENGMVVEFTAGDINTGPSTVNVNGIGLVNVLDGSGNALSGGEIAGGVKAVSNGVDFLLDDSKLFDRGSIDGFITAPDTVGGDTDHDITINAGKGLDSNNGFNIRLSTALTKQIDADWVEGTDSGGFPSGLTLAIDTWYHLFVIAKADGTVDAGWDTSINATNLLADASDFTLFRRIASNLTDASSNIVAYDQDGDWFTWGVLPIDLDDTTPSTAGLPITISTPPGVKTRARIISQMSKSTGATILFTEISSTNEATDSAHSHLQVDSTGQNSTNAFTILTDASSQIRYRSSTGTVTSFSVAVAGHIDTRGKE